MNNFSGPPPGLAGEGQHRQAHSPAARSPAAMSQQSAYFPPFEDQQQNLSGSPSSETRNRPRAGTMPSRTMLSSAAAASMNNAFGQQAQPQPQSATATRPDMLRRHLSSLVPHSTLLPSSGTTTPSRISPSASAQGSPALTPVGELAPAASISNESRMRLRSGSLTLAMPQHSVENAFVPGIFASAWTPSLEDLKSVRSSESVASGDEGQGVLDYLGLDGPSSPSHNHMTPSLMGSLRRQPSLDAQLYSMQGVQSSPGNRLRANTVASPTPKPSTDLIPATIRRRQSSALLSSLSSLPESSSASVMTQDFAGMHLRDQSNDTDATDDDAQLYYSTATEAMPAEQDDYVPPIMDETNLHTFQNRPRASTVGLLDTTSLSPNMRRRAGTATGIFPGSRMPVHDISDQYEEPEDHKSVHTGSGESAGVPMYNVMSTPGMGQTRHQMAPSRSLWIGNLSVHATAQDLLAAFGSYGVVDSVRILPEKNCAFVNFNMIESAMAAKEDIQIRHGGQIFGSTVRLGFGKTESVPATPMTVNGSATPASVTAAALGDFVDMSPTRALWVGSVPPAATSNDLVQLFSPYGTIESARILAHKGCGFVNMDRLEDAVRAKKQLNGKEIFGFEAGSVKIGFAKVPARPEDGIAASPGSHAYMAGDQPDFRNYNGAPMPSAGQALQAAVSSPEIHQNGWQPHREASPAAPSELQQMLRDLCGTNDPDLESDIRVINAMAIPSMPYFTSIPLAATEDQMRGRKPIDSASLREVRKRLESNLMQAGEYDAVANDLLQDVVWLSSDYIGNTIIQKLFEQCSPAVKMVMLERIAPYLASIGCHKNGTWAAQKILDTAASADEVAVICRHMIPYIPPLLLDQFGNYCVQCMLRYGAPATDGIFDAIVHRCWEIAQGRFGARSIRTCLESPFATRLHQKRVAMAIISHCVPLALNPNGTLLLTWLLDTSNLRGRYKLLAPRLSPHLGHLCTHKLASATVLRVVNQKADPNAVQVIVHGLFEAGAQTLEEVLCDQVHGLAFLQRFLCSPFLESAQKSSLINKVETAIGTLNLQAIPIYQRFIEQVHSGTPGDLGNGASSRTSSFNPAKNTPPMQQYGQFSSPHQGSPMNRQPKAFASPQQFFSPPQHSSPYFSPHTKTSPVQQYGQPFNQYPQYQQPYGFNSGFQQYQPYPMQASPSQH